MGDSLLQYLTDLVGGRYASPLEKLPVRYAEGRVTHAPIVFYDSQSAPAQRLFNRNGLSVRGWFDPKGSVRDALLMGREEGGPSPSAISGEAAKLQLASPDTIGRGVIQVNMDPGFFTPAGNLTQLSDGRLVDGRAPAVRHEQVHYAVAPFIGALDPNTVLAPEQKAAARAMLLERGYPEQYVDDPRKLSTEALATYSQESASSLDRDIFRALLQGVQRASPQAAAQVQRLAAPGVARPEGASSR
jgi:hypothetical protein